MLITQKIIRDLFVGTDSGEENHKFVTILGLIVLIFAPFFLILKEYFMFIAFLSLSGFMYFLVWRSKNVIGDIIKSNYVIYKDVCTGKKTEIDSEGPNSIFLYFQKKKKVEVNFPFIIWNSQAATSPHYIYNDAHDGDVFYLLCNKRNKVLYIFNSKIWGIDESEFTLSDELYIPKK